MQSGHDYNTLSLTIKDMLIYIFLLLLLAAPFYARRLRLGNAHRRVDLLKTLGHNESEKKNVVGFFHPYWCAECLCGLKNVSIDHADRVSSV